MFLFINSRFFQKIKYPDRERRYLNKLLCLPVVKLFKTWSVIVFCISIKILQSSFEISYSCSIESETKGPRDLPWTGIQRYLIEEWSPINALQLASTQPRERQIVNGHGTPPIVEPASPRTSAALKTLIINNTNQFSLIKNFTCKFTYYDYGFISARYMDEKPRLIWGLSQMSNRDRFDCWSEHSTVLKHPSESTFEIQKMTLILKWIK